MKAKPKIIIIGCCYTIDPELFARKLNNALKEYYDVAAIYIASSKIVKSIKTSDGVAFVAAPKLDNDFSSYISAAEIAYKEHFGLNLFFFVNDTVFINHSHKANFKAISRQSALLDELQTPGIAGRADPYSYICFSNPWSGYCKYISTYCFMLNRSALPTIFKLPKYAEDDSVTYEFLLADSRWGGGLSVSFREFLRSAILYRSSPYAWYQLKGSQFTESQLASKVRCIYFEHRLSGEIGKNGCILPVNAGLKWGMYLKVFESLAKFKNMMVNIRS